MSKSKHKNEFEEFNYVLKTDDFICKYKHLILKHKVLMDKFFKQYQPYLYKAARNIAKNYPTLELDALVNEGFEGMIRALKKYESKYASFLTYAQYWVNMKMTTYANKTLLTVSLPGNIHAMLSKYNRIVSSNPEIPKEELLRQLNVSERQFTALLKAAAIKVSKDTDVETNKCKDIAQADEKIHVMYSDELAIKKLEKENIKKLIKQVLSPKEYYVIASLYGLDSGYPKVLERVGKVLNVSKERIRQIKEAAFDKIRNSGVLHDFR